MSRRKDAARLRRLERESHTLESLKLGMIKNLKIQIKQTKKLQQKGISKKRKQRALKIHRNARKRFLEQRAQYERLKRTARPKAPTAFEKLQRSLKQKEHYERLERIEREKDKIRLLGLEKTLAVAAKVFVQSVSNFSDGAQNEDSIQEAALVFASSHVIYYDIRLGQYTEDGSNDIQENMRRRDLVADALVNHAVKIVENPEANAKAAAGEDLCEALGSTWQDYHTAFTESQVSLNVNELVDLALKGITTSMPIGIRFLTTNQCSNLISYGAQAVTEARSSNYRTAYILFLDKLFIIIKLQIGYIINQKMTVQKTNLSPYINNAGDTILQILTLQGAETYPVKKHQKTMDIHDVPAQYKIRLVLDSLNYIQSLLFPNEELDELIQTLLDYFKRNPPITYFERHPPIIDRIMVLQLQTMNDYINPIILEEFSSDNDNDDDDDESSTTTTITHDDYTDVDMIDDVGGFTTEIIRSEPSDTTPRLLADPALSLRRRRRRRKKKKLGVFPDFPRRAPRREATARKQRAEAENKRQRQKTQIEANRKKNRARKRRKMITDQKRVIETGSKGQRKVNLKDLLDSYLNDFNAYLRRYKNNLDSVTIIRLAMAGPINALAAGYTPTETLSGVREQIRMHRKLITAYNSLQYESFLPVWKFEGHPNVKLSIYIWLNALRAMYVTKHWNRDRSVLLMAVFEKFFRIQKRPETYSPPTAQEVARVTAFAKKMKMYKKLRRRINFIV